MGMATSYDPVSGVTVTEHECRFFGHMRASPAGGNRRNVSVIIATCSCGKIRAKFPEKLTHWDARWIERVNRRVERRVGDG